MRTRRSWPANSSRTAPRCTWRAATPDLAADHLEIAVVARQQTAQEGEIALVQLTQVPTLSVNAVMVGVSLAACATAFAMSATDTC
jgi:hypothetical protein